MEINEELLPKIHRLSVKKHRLLYLQAQQLITQKKNVSLAKEVLKKLGYEPDGTPKQPSLKNKPISKLVNAMTVAVTGAFPGDTLIGSRKKVSEKAVFKVHHKVIPPYRPYIEYIKTDSGWWGTFLQRLDKIPFYRDLSLKEREVWLEQNSDQANRVLGEINGTKIEVIDPGESNLTTQVTETNLEILLKNNDGKYWDYKEIENYFPRKPGSEAEHNTLILFRSFWKVATNYETTGKYSGPVIFVESGKTTFNREVFGNILLINGFPKTKKKEKGKWIVSDYQEIGFMVPKNSNKSTSELSTLTDKILRDLIETSIFIQVPENVQETLNKVTEYLQTFSPGALKSLFQKLIRYQAYYTIINSQQVVTEVVLLVTMRLLCIHPGSFVPDIQRYVTGFESFTKRLSVIITEDSSFKNMYTQVSLLGSATVTQITKQIHVTENMLRKWFLLGLASLQSTKKFAYNRDNGEKLGPSIITSTSKPLEVASTLLEYIKAFTLDYYQLRDVAETFPNKTEYSTSEKRPILMPFEHCIDQHWAPSIVYFYEYQTLQKYQNNVQSRPFGKLLKTLFTTVTGINPRRKIHHQDWEMFEQIPFVQQTRKAQTLYLSAIKTPTKERSIIKEKNYLLSSTLHDSWLSAFIGPIPIGSVKQPLIVTLDTNNLYNYMVIRKPSRTAVDTDIPKDKVEFSINQAKEKLKIGLKLQNTHIVSKKYGNNLYVFLTDDNEYIISPDKNQSKKSDRWKWDDFRKLQYHLPVHPPLDYNDVSLAFINHGNGIQKNAYMELEKVLHTYPEKILRRSLVFLDTFNTNVSLHPVSRDGGPTERQVQIEDNMVYKLLLQLSILFPGALQINKNNPIDFKVQHLLLLQEIVFSIKTFLTKENKEDVDSWFPKENNTNKSLFVDTMETREVKEYQEETIKRMINNHRNGKKGNIIWFTVGSGKTYMILRYLKYLYHQKELPKYIIYTMPQTAFGTVINEMQTFGLPIQIIVPLKVQNRDYSNYFSKGIEFSVTQDCEAIKERSIILIEHDHLRKCREKLLEIVSNSILIIDEMHKAENETQRTSVLLELAWLSKEFTGMTGTLVMDDKIYRLIWWLQQIVPFTVNEKNFLVAANSMLIKNITTNIPKKYIEDIANFTESERKVYQQNISPDYGGLNPQFTEVNKQKAIDVCYSACSKKMIDLVMEYILNNHRVMLVADNQKHQENLFQMLLQKKIVSEKDIFLLTKTTSIDLTYENVEKKETPAYKVVIVPVSKSEGYNLTYLDTMITSVYFSNNATREQLEGRINRIGQKAKELYYITVHIGLLSYLHMNHRNARSLSVALKSVV